MSNYSPKNSVTLTGFILATDFNRRGKVMEIVFETEDFQQYTVTETQKGKELFDLLYSKVTVHGYITGKDAYGNQIIKIEDYEINDRVQLVNE